METQSIPSDSLSIRIFGDFVFERKPNQPLSFKSRKTEAVLLTLALNQSLGVSRDMLCGLIWPDLTQDRAKAGLRQALSRIRSLAPHVIKEPKRGWLCLSEEAVICDFWILLKTLEDSSSAELSVPQGGLLSHYPCPTDLFSEWVETQKRFIISEIEKRLFTLIGDTKASKEKRRSACEFVLQMSQTDDRLISQILEFCKATHNEALYRSTWSLYCHKLETELNLKPSLSFAQKFPKDLFSSRLTQAETDATHNVPVLAVIEKFQVRGNNPDHAYLGEALPDDIITHLARQNWFDVQLKNLSWPEKPANVTEADLAHHEHSYWLYGTIHVHDDMIEVSVRLTHGASERIVWSEVFEETFSNLMNIRRRIVDVIAEHLTTKMVDSMSEYVSSGTDDTPVDVWAATMQARHLFWRTSFENNEKASLLLDPILKMENPPVSAFVISAFTRLLKVWSVWSDDLDGEMKAAIQIAEKAIRLHPNDHWAHFALATCYGATRQAEKAERTLNRALSLHDSFAAALGLRGHLRVFGGELDAGTKDLKNSLKLNAIDPHYGIWQNSVAIAAYLRNDYAAALIWVNKALATNSYWMQNYVVLTCIYHELGDFEKAASHFEKLKKISPKFSRDNWLFSHPFTHAPSEEKFLKALENYGF